VQRVWTPTRQKARSKGKP